MDIEAVFNSIRTGLNAISGLPDFSMSPKHPDFVSSFPYTALAWQSQTFDWEGSDNRWITPINTRMNLQAYIFTAPPWTDHPSLELARKAKLVQDKIAALTAAEGATYRCRVVDITTEYEASGKWAAAIITINVGA